MSHQTGIKASEDLKKHFASCKDGTIRFLKVVIKDEKIELACSEPPRRSWEDDYDPFVLPNLIRKEVCCMLYRFDSKSNKDFQWLLITFTPDDAPVKQKMLYAATKATLKQEFGASNIKDELSGTEKEEVSLQGYKTHLEAKKAPAPLTMAEEELEEIKRNEIKTAGVDAKHQTVQGIDFPFQEDARDQLQQMATGSVNFVHLKLEISQEEVHLGNSGNLSPDQLSSQIPNNTGSYTLYRFDHTHEGDYHRSIVFIYCMPGYKCPVKERMLYSSCKSTVLEVIENQIGLELARKLEIDSPAELNEKFLYEEVHPQRDIVRQQFSRPKGPAGRGPKRMTKK